MRLRYVQSFVNKETGTVFHYFRRRGHKRVRLPGVPGSRNFMEAYQRALEGPQAPIGAKRTKSGSVSAALVGYYASPIYFGQLAPQTQSARRAILERFRAAHGDLPIADMPAKFIALTLSQLKPQAARNWHKAIRHLMQYAVSVGLVRVDPTQGIKLPRVKSKEHRPWTDQEVAAYESTHPSGSKARLAFALGYFTAQRRGDAVRMGRQHIAGNHLQVRQDKTDVALEIPIHHRLRVIIEGAVPPGQLTFLVTNTGKSYKAADFGKQFRVWCNQAGLPSDCHFHGLRYSAAKMLAESGCTPHQIAAITGHKTLAMVQKYSAGVEQRRLASEAMAKLVANDPAT